MSGYTTKSFIKANTTQSPGANASAVEVSKIDTISHEDSLRLNIAVTVAGSDFTGAAFSVQDSYDGTTWTTRKSAVTTSSATTFYWTFDQAATADVAELTIKPIVRVIYSSGAGADATITRVIRTSRP